MSPRHLVRTAADAAFDGEHYHLVPGDVARAGVGCLHEFSNAAALRRLRTPERTSHG